MGKGSGDEDDAAAAAKEARESLERMWAASAGGDTQKEDEDDDQLLREVRQALPELEGEGADGSSAKVGLESHTGMMRCKYSLALTEIDCVELLCSAAVAEKKMSRSSDMNTRLFKERGCKVSLLHSSKL